jgi:hypothetical protein
MSLKQRQTRSRWSAPSSAPRFIPFACCPTERRPKSVRRIDERSSDSGRPIHRCSSGPPHPSHPSGWLAIFRQRRHPASAVLAQVLTTHCTARPHALKCRHQRPGSGRAAGWGYRRHGEEDRHATGKPTSRGNRQHQSRRYLIILFGTKGRIFYQFQQKVLLICVVVRGDAGGTRIGAMAEFRMPSSATTSQ